MKITAKPKTRRRSDNDPMPHLVVADIAFPVRAGLGNLQIAGKRAPRLSKATSSAPRTIENAIQSRSFSSGLLKENDSRPGRHQPPAGPGATRLDRSPLGPRPPNGFASMTGLENTPSGNCVGASLAPPTLAPWSFQYSPPA